MRQTVVLDRKLTLKDVELLSEKVEQAVFLNSNSTVNTSYLALGEKVRFSPVQGETFHSLQQFVDEQQDWIVGYLGYDLKNEIEPKLSSKNSDNTKFSDTHFFVPKWVVEFTEEQSVLYFHKKEEKEEFLSFLEGKTQKKHKKSVKISFSQTMGKSEYEKKFKLIKHHIQQGDIYEMNFCHEFYAEKVEINPFKTYQQLNELTNAPFSAYYKNGDQFILSASPERYIKKEGNKILTEPIKGTAKRGKTQEEDEQIKLALSLNEKERSENIMIVDLVRNDLSKTAQKSSVKVEELCKVYSFDTVHQMISKVTSTIDESTHPVEVLRTTFPMGSMTGAPKVEAMKIIEEVETTKRGVYSGSIGYIKPNGDFDFNVVIRTLLYNQENQYLSFMVGGAITNKANVKDEYKETLLKAEAMIKSVK